MPTKGIRVDIAKRIVRDAIVICISRASALCHDGLDVDPADRIAKSRASVHIEKALTDQPLIPAAVKIHIIFVRSLGCRGRKV